MRLLAALPFLLLACATARPADALPEHGVLSAEEAWYAALAAKDVTALERVFPAPSARGNGQLSRRTRPSMPPATVTTSPVTWPDTTSDASITATRATSSG